MKRTLALLMALAMMLAMTAGLAESASSINVGTLSFLNMPEDRYFEMGQLYQGGITYLFEQGIIVPTPEAVENKDRMSALFKIFDSDDTKMVYYDNLDSLVMALQKGDILSAFLPLTTVKYLCAQNDEFIHIMDVSDVEPDAFARLLLARNSYGYSFMLMEDHAELRDQINAAIGEMKQDGTLDALTQKYIYDAIDGAEPEAVAFEQTDGETIKVAVTGSLPPMDYVAPDGTFAGFNTALLAELGKRIEKNFELVQVDSLGRAAALASGTADMVFWTRGWSYPLSQMGFEETPKSLDELADWLNLTEEQVEMGLSMFPDSVNLLDAFNGDIPEGTIITTPYFTDYTLMVMRKAD